jgi:hypothetical protein
VESEVAWRNAMEEWKAYDLRLITSQQYSDATVVAHRTLEDAQTAVLRVENAVKGAPSTIERHGDSARGGASAALTVRAR